MSEKKADGTPEGLMPSLGFEKDLKREDEGDWFTLDAVPGNYPELSTAVTRVRVRSRHTSEYRQAEINMQMKAMRKKERERIDFGLKEANRLVASHCLVDWEMNDVNGEIFSFTKERAVLLMTDDRYRDFQRFVNECIAVLQGDIEEVQEEISGN
jgi:hypothetical protein